MESRVRAKDGRYRLIKDHGHFYASEDGELICMAGFITDITEQRRAEEELRASEERFRKVFAHAATGMTLQSLEGVFLEVNRAFCEITGYHERDLIGKNYRSITHPEDLARNLTGMEELLAAKVPSLLLEKRYQSKDGRVVWVRNSVSLVRDSEGTPMHMIVLVEDITEQRRAEEELRASEERFRKVFAHAVTGMTLQDFGGNFLEVNQAFCGITGYEERELVGADYRSVTHPDDLAKTSRRTEELLAGEIPSFVLENRYVRKDRRSVWVRSSVSLLGDSKPPRIITLVEDITERKQAEEALRQLSGRLLQAQDEERRRLARELHDGTAQSIAGLGMNLSMVRESASALDGRTKRALDESVQLADQCIRELRTLSYLLHPPMLDDRGLAPALSGYTEGFSERSGIAVKLELTPDLGRLPQAVELMLFRVVQESLTNIHRHSGSRTATIRLARYPQDIVLQVRDQGNGIGKTAGRGGGPGTRIGVGIAGMRERVRQIGGTLQIRSRPGGTDVEVVVPLSDPYR
jgi:PAS domain S-box-containing protein